DHKMVDTPALGADAEGDGVIAIVAVHEDGSDHILAHAEFVFDTPAHPERGVKALRGCRIVLAHDGVAHPAGTGLEASVHPAARMERLAVLDFGAVENFD